MSIPQSVAEVLREHVVLEVEAIDRMYLNVYVPHLQSVGAVVGFVSRVTPVQTAMRNCTRDEGRSFEVGNQVLISNHRKLLWSKATVVNVAEKSERDSGRYD
jgi:hypothetical protein